MRKLGSLLLAALLTASAAGPAFARPAAPKRDCCGKSCPAPKAKLPNCCRVAPATPAAQAVAPRAPAPAAVFADRVTLVLPRRSPRAAPLAAVSPGPPGPSCDAPSGLSPPARLPA